MCTAPLPLILGAAGRVGRLLRPHLPAGTPLSARAAGPGLLAWDLQGGPEPLRGWLETAPLPPALVVLAGATPATAADMEGNLRVAVVAMEAALAAGIPRVLLSSSAAVYGGPRAAPWREEDASRPSTPYGLAKLEMERAARPYREKGLEVCALRIGNVAGADALLLNAGGPIRLDRFADGEGPRRSYLGPASLAGVLLALARPGLRLPETLNLGAPAAVTMSSLLEAAGLGFDWQAAPTGAAQDFTLDCSRLAGLIALPSDAGSPQRIITEWRASLAQTPFQQERR